MKITHLGHASLLVDTGDTRLLFDPVFFDPHQEQTLTVYPERTINLERLPRYEVLVITHHHLDHFDLATLAALPRDVVVLIPQNPLIEYSLRTLRYESIYALDADVVVEFGGARILTTPSAVPFPEFGIVVRTDSAVIWNQVDTILTPAVIDSVLERMGRIDLLIAPWQPMLEMVAAHNEPAQFPTFAYGELLSNIARTRPAALVPGANGFRYKLAPWLNGVVFPQSVERFLHDVSLMLPETAALSMNPGDVIEVCNATIERRESASFVHALPRNPFALQFAPMLSDHVDAVATSRGRREEDLVDQVCGPMLDDLFRRSAFNAHRQWQILFQLEIVWCGESDFRLIDFRDELPRCQRGRSEIANFFCRVTGAGLADVADGRCTWERLIAIGALQQWHRIYGVCDLGVVPASNVRIDNPLFMLLPDDANFAHVIDRELERINHGIEAVSLL